ncbi:MAG TPA: primosomal protein N', partial [Cyclobacteriaceae bacterium]|nr:primosomal protein N' [Cyclobacteriaceae bacterium]
MTDLQIPDLRAGNKFFADVILPLPLPKSFTYEIPGEIHPQVSVGSRVIVQFGSKKILTGIVASVHANAPANYDPRTLLDVLDDNPVLYPGQLKLYEWMAGYYMCTLGEVINAALPSGLKLSSESKVMMHPDIPEGNLAFNEKENQLLLALEGGKSLTYSQAARMLDLKNAYHVIKSLLNKKSVLIYEEVKDKYVPKREARIRLGETYRADPSSLEELFKALERHPMQVDLLMQYLKHVNVMENPGENEVGIAKSVMLKAGSQSSLKTLVRNKVFEEFHVVIPRFPEIPQEGTRLDLTADQESARKKILELLPQKNAVLLHGITGSGKTEIYTDIIRHYLDSGSQVLYLLPEIALTTHIVSRLKNFFGTRMAVYHSKYSDNERVEVWQGVLNGRFRLVAGVRSSVFLPFRELGLVIIDEEHEPSYKQPDPAPRYHARDTALVMALQSGAHVLLGSATPSIESYFHAKQEKYGYVRLDKRFGKAVLPEIRVVDTKKERRQKLMKSDFSSVLLTELEKTLTEKKQAILFQNRRGYSPYIICDDCGN